MLNGVHAFASGALVAESTWGELEASPPVSAAGDDKLALSDGFDDPVAPFPGDPTESTKPHSQPPNPDKPQAFWHLAAVFALGVLSEAVGGIIANEVEALRRPPPAPPPPSPPPPANPQAGIVITPLPSTPGSGG